LISNPLVFHIPEKSGLDEDDDMEIAGPDDNEAYEDDRQLEQIQQSEENDEETATIVVVVAGAYPNATKEQKHELLKGSHEHGNAVLATLEHWKTHGTT
jgi:predicted  nucleic acid-binding Zn-ribbon protein